MGAKLKRLVALAVAASLLAGCAAGISPQGFVRDRSAPDQYAFRIDAAGFAGSETADAAALQEIRKFMEKERYRRYDIVSRRHHPVPAYYIYVVRFSRD